MLGDLLKLNVQRLLSVTTHVREVALTREEVINVGGFIKTQCAAPIVCHYSRT